MNKLVSVCIFSYNHEEYISQCIEGVLSQITNFDFEIIIGEDGSQDNTINILDKFSKKYPNTIKVLFQDQTKKIYIGGKPTGRYNFITTLNACRGKYIALCDGDDYWTDPLKLQRQVDFMEANPEYSFCATNYQTLCDKNYKQIIVENPIVDINNIFIKNRCATATLFFRKEVFQAIMTVNFSKIAAGDWFVQAYACVHFNPGYILPESTAVYRIHNEGVWSQLNKKEMGKKGVDVLKNFKTIFNDKKVLRKINRAIKLRESEFGLKKDSLLFKILRKIRKGL